MSRCTVAGSCRFLSTLSLRRATGAEIQDPGQVLFLSTLSLRRATKSKRAINGFKHISIHALLAESDIISQANRCAAVPFLSTLSLRRATAIRSAFAAKNRIFLSTLSLRRATRFGWLIFRCYIISIHALLAESDHVNTLLLCYSSVTFLSTLSLRRATGPRGVPGDLERFLSTLSLRRATRSAAQIL